jgi:hypothetical protein
MTNEKTYLRADLRFEGGAKKNSYLVKKSPMPFKALDKFIASELTKRFIHLRPQFRQHVAGEPRILF